MITYSTLYLSMKKFIISLVICTIFLNLDKTALGSSDAEISNFNLFESNYNSMVNTFYSSKVITDSAITQSDCNCKSIVKLATEKIEEYEAYYLSDKCRSCSCQCPTININKNNINLVLYFLHKLLLIEC